MNTNTDKLKYLVLMNPDGTQEAYLTEISDVEVTNEMNGEYSLTFKYHINDDNQDIIKKIQNEYIILTLLDRELFRIYSITRDDDNDTLEIKCNHYTLDLINNPFVTYEWTTTKYLGNILGDIKNLLVNPTDITVTWDWDDVDRQTVEAGKWEKTNLYDVILKYCDTYGLIINRTKKNIHISKQKSTYEGIEFRYNKDVTGVKIEDKDDGIYNQVVPIGKDGLTVTGYVVNSPLIDNYAVKKAIVKEYSDITTEADLITEALKEFSDNNIDKPIISISLNYNGFINASELFNIVTDGWAKRPIDYLNFKPGDVVRVVRGSVEYMYNTNILSIKTDYMTQDIKEITLGNKPDSFTASVSADLSKKASQSDFTALQTSVDTKLADTPTNEDVQAMINESISGLSTGGSFNGNYNNIKAVTLSGDNLIVNKQVNNKQNYQYYDKTFYIKNTGSDDNDGLSEATSIKTFYKLSGIIGNYINNNRIINVEVKSDLNENIYFNYYGNGSLSINFNGHILRGKIVNSSQVPITIKYLTINNQSITNVTNLNGRLRLENCNMGALNSTAVDNYDRFEWNSGNVWAQKAFVNRGTLIFTDTCYGKATSNAIENYGSAINGSSNSSLCIPTGTFNTAIGMTNIGTRLSWEKALEFTPADVNIKNYVFLPNSYRLLDLNTNSIGDSLSKDNGYIDIPNGKALVMDLNNLQTITDTIYERLNILRGMDDAGDTSLQVEIIGLKYNNPSVRTSYGTYSINKTNSYVSINTTATQLESLIKNGGTIDRLVIRPILSSGTYMRILIVPSDCNGTGEQINPIYTGLFLYGQYLG
jgi:phage minor structural protein